MKQNYKVPSLVIIANSCRIKDYVKEAKTYLQKNKIPYQDIIALSTQNLQTQ